MSTNAGELANQLNTLADKSHSARDVANSLSAQNMEDSSETMQKLHEYIQDVNSACVKVTSSITGIDPFESKSDQEKILQAYTASFKQEKAFLEILAEKGGQLSKDVIQQIHQPLLSQLQSYEGAVDEIGYAVVGVCPDVQGEISKEMMVINQAFRQAILAWTG